MRLFDLVVASKLAGGSGGGGGSSDFSFANVTIINNTSNYDVNMDGFIFIYLDEMAIGGIEVSRGASDTMEVVLYKDMPTYGSYTVTPGINVTATGDIEIDTEYGDVKVYGDGTITFSNA